MADLQTDPGISGGSSLGRALKRARLGTGYDIAAVASILRIRPEYLEALEEGSHVRLPGRVYAIGFVRTYASFLGLDPAVAIERFKAEAGDLDHTQLQPPTPPPEGRVPGGALLFVSVLGAALLYGGWWMVSAQDRRMPDIVAEVPDRLKRLVDSVVESSETMFVRLPRAEQPAPQPNPPVAAPPQLAVAPPQPQSLAQPASPVPRASIPAAPSGDETESAEGQEDDESSRPSPEQARPVASAVPGAPQFGAAQSGASPSGTAAPGPNLAALPPGQVQTLPGAAGDGNGRILLRAREENWVQVRDGGNAPLMTRVLKPGDVLKVPDRSGLTLMTGNAGGLDIVVDGETIPSLGATGQVRRNVALDADKLKAGTALGRP
jgi:cytoskeletal protein RodZ